MDSIFKTNEVTDQCKLSNYKFPELTEICEEELSNSYENYQESVFRSLSANFDNISNINSVNEAYDNMEKCFIENNILTRHGISKFKASASTKLLLQYRDIEDAFADMVFSENARKRLDGNEMIKKIDLKRFKDDVFPIKLYDFPLSDNEDSQSNSEGIEDSESLLESFQSDNEVSDHDEICENEAPANLDMSNGFRSELSLSVDLPHLGDKSEAESNDKTEQSDNSADPLKNIVRDVRVVVEKLPEDISDASVNDEDDNSFTESDKKSSFKETRQVARKRTGGMVSNAVYDDINIKDQKIIQHLNSKDGDFIPNVFDKMTRAGKRDLERVLAESTANLVIQKTSQLITEKIKELHPSDNQIGSSSSEDEDAESDIHKTAEIVTNTIIEFLTKSKCKKLEKLGKDISVEISSKLNSLKFGNETETAVSESDVNQTQTSNKSNSPAENKIEISLENKNMKLSGDKLEEDCSLKRITRESLRKKNTNIVSLQDAEALEELTKIENEMHESLENCANIVDKDSDFDEPRRPETRQSKQKQEDDSKNTPERDSYRDEPRRPETRQSKLKTEEAKHLLERDEPRRPTRLSRQKQEDDAKNILEKDCDRDEPRRPETRQSKQKVEDVKNFPERDSGSDEPKRRETRLSKQKQDDNLTIMFESVVPKVKTKPGIKNKRKRVSRSKRRKGSNKQTGKNSCYAVTEVSTVGQLIDGQFLIDSELNEEPPFCVSNSSPNQLLKASEEFTINTSPPFADSTILKASADSTTFDATIINDERSTNDIDCLDESNSEKAGKGIQPVESDADTNIVRNETNKSFELSCSDVGNMNAKNSYKDKDVQCHSSQDGNNSQYSFASDNLKHTDSSRQSDEEVSNTVDSTNKKLGSDIKNGLLNINEKSNQLIENKSNIGLESTKIKNLSSEGGTSKQQLNTLKPVKEKRDSEGNDISEVSFATSTYVPSQLLNDIMNIEKGRGDNSDSRGLQEIGGVGSEESTETLADSTSFLNYTLDDSLRLVVDESTPHKEATMKQAQGTENSAEPKTNTDLMKQNIESQPELETGNILNNENYAKDPGQEKLGQKDVDEDNEVNAKTVEKNKTKPSLLKPENKEGSSAKALTNEEKIARITNRDPRLVNDKKLTNVLIRDPRLRNKLPKVDESQEKPVQPKLPPPMILDSPQSPDPSPDVASIKPPPNIEQIGEKNMFTKDDTKTSELQDNNDLNRRKKLKKEIDEELLYKTPLSDLHASTSADRPTYVRSVKPKRQGQLVRKDKDLNEDGRSIGRNRPFEEPIEERRHEENIGVYGEPVEDSIRGRHYNHGPSSFNERTFRIPNNEEVNHRLEEENFGGNYERRDFQPVRQQDFQSASRMTYEAEGFARRTPPNSERRDLSDNQFYSRREFYRRNKYSHDHDHFSNSSRFVEIREESPFCSQFESFGIPDDSVFRASAYPPVSLLPDPMYSQEEDFDQSFTNMDTDSFSPPSSDLCPPPPPVIRPPTPDRLRRENFCPSPPRIGRDSPDRDYEQYSRPFHRNYDRDERICSRGRNNFSRDSVNTRSYRGGNYRRGNGRDYRRNEDSPPRKRFVTEHFSGREDDRGRWRRSPSWSPDRSRRWSSDRSLSPPEQQPWSPPEPRPWDSPPPPPRRPDHYRERTQSYKNYRRY